MDQYECWKCESQYTTGNMEPVCVSCFQAMSRRLDGAATKIEELCAQAQEYERVLKAKDEAIRCLIYKENGKWLIGFHGDTDVTKYVAEALSLRPSWEGKEKANG